MSLTSDTISETAYELLIFQIVENMIKEQGAGKPLEYQDKLLAKVEQMGYSIGFKMAERAAKDAHKLSDIIDKIKFICKEFWNLLFHKSVDKLTTDHKGGYMLEDTAFRWLVPLAACDGMDEVAEAKMYLVLPVGIIRGALHNLGISATVTASVGPSVPQCAFKITIVA